MESAGRFINTGTWLKLLDRVAVHFGWLPAVYYPSFRLSYFCIEKENYHLVYAYGWILAGQNDGRYY